MTNIIGQQSDRNRITTSASKRGVALILVLGFVTVLALLVMGFMAAIRVEYSSARTYNDLIKTRNLAESALSDAMARVAEATRTSIHPPRSRPGSAAPAWCT